MPNIHKNLSQEELYNLAVSRNEARVSNTKSLVVETGKYTGRSPKDKFIADTPDIHDEVDWGDVNFAISEENYKKLYNLIQDYIGSLEDIFVQDVSAGADPDSSMSFEITHQYAYQALFSSYLLRKPSEGFVPDFKVYVAPGCKCPNPPEYGLNSEAFIVVNMQEKVVLIGGSKYSGEIKKSIFSIMNHLMPKKGVLPMHCSANMGDDGRTALFFGLSGTGKTTLSTDEDRKLIGDDEHGWGDDGIFNFEGGCYAKCIDLSREKEPQIFDAIRYATVIENVIMSEKGEFDFTDVSLTQNSRAGYPIDYISGAVESGMGGHPSAVIFLTADAFGVMPPISRLDKTEAMYHFISGYTSKLAGTERGIDEPQAVFSSFFGKPFMPLKPMVYARLLGEKLEKHGSRVFLINTGWTGGPYGVGKRMEIKHSRGMVAAALNGDLDNVEYDTHPIFNLKIPKSCPGVPSEILNPRNTWQDKEAYDKKAGELADAFRNNISKFPGVTEEIKNVL